MQQKTNRSGITVIKLSFTNNNIHQIHKHDYDTVSRLVNEVNILINKPGPAQVGAISKAQK